MFGSVSPADTTGHLQSSTSHVRRTAQTWALELSLADRETASGGGEGYEENVETSSVFYGSEFGDELVSEHAAEGTSQPAAAGAPQTRCRRKGAVGGFRPRSANAIQSAGLLTHCGL